MSDQYEPPAFEEIQGNIWPGFNKPFQAFIFLRFASGADGAKAARAWLTSIKPRVTRASDVMAFKDARSLVEDRLPGRSADIIRSTWLNVAFTHQGLRRLVRVDDAQAGLVPSSADLASFPSDFSDGMYNRYNEIGDNPIDRAAWLVGGDPGTEAHAILILGADRQSNLQQEIQRQDRLRKRYDLTECCVIHGAMLKQGREHFGFRDGVTQIRLDDKTPNGETTHDASPNRVPWDALNKDGDRLPSGELILGPGRPRYKSHQKPLTYPEWAKNGSFVVVRRLQQHVDRFHERVAQEATRLSTKYGHDLPADLLEAKMIGRWPSGAKLGWNSPPEWRDPALGGEADPAHVPVTKCELTAACGTLDHFVKLRA